jgi:plastocyanin
LTRKLIIAFAALAIAAFGLAACGDDDSDTDTGATTTDTTQETTTDADGGGAAVGGTIKVEADPSGALEYTTGDLEVDAGVVTIDFDNPASVDHDVRIEDSSGADLGGTSVFTESSESAEVELEPGTYTYYCSVPGHRQAGMEAKLTVK